MALCRGCGARIDWIKMKTGKLMPVNPEAVMVIEAEGLTGKEAFVTDEGDLIRGRRALPEEEDKGLPVGFVPHWARLTAAGMEPEVITAILGELVVEDGAVTAPDWTRVLQ